MRNFSDIKVLVIGDVMLDRYWWGNVSRVSPEAPVPVVNLEKISATLGGAANVAANVAGLGAKPYLTGVVGKDSEADLLFEQLESAGIAGDFLIKSSDRPTTVKTRIIAHNQQIVRVDQEIKNDLTELEEKEIWQTAEALIETVDIVIISDYAKGVLKENLLSRLITKCFEMGKLVLADPKGKNFSKYRGVSMLTPNRFEFAEIAGDEDLGENSFTHKGFSLLSEFSLNYLLVTQGEGGMTLFEKNREALHLPVEPRNVYDVTGAGDTVIACLAVSMAAGGSFLESAKLANRAAGLVIEKLGTTAITKEMLKQSESD